VGEEIFEEGLCVPVTEQDFWKTRSNKDLTESYKVNDLFANIQRRLLK
jgi:hypothetical protein